MVPVGLPKLHHTELDCSLPIGTELDCTANICVELYCTAPICTEQDYTAHICNKPDCVLDCVALSYSPPPSSAVAVPPTLWRHSYSTLLLSPGGHHTNPL